MNFNAFYLKSKEPMPFLGCNPCPESEARVHNPWLPTDGKLKIWRCEQSKSISFPRTASQQACSRQTHSPVAYSNDVLCLLKKTKKRLFFKLSHFRAIYRALTSYPTHFNSMTRDFITGTWIFSLHNLSHLWFSLTQRHPIL